VKGEGCLDDTGNTSTSFKMADVRLDGTDVTWVLRSATGGRSVDGCDSGNLLRIADAGGSSVSLNEINCASIEPGSAERLLVNLRLCLGVRLHDAIGSAILSDGGTFDDGKDLIAIADGILDTLHDDNGGTFTTTVSLGLSIKRSAATFG